MGIIIPNMGMPDKLPKKIQSISMADALFSTTQQRVLAHIFGQPERSFYASELIRLSAGGSGAIQRELARMEKSGLITVTRIGSQKHYQANPDAPIYAELCGIVQKTVGLVEPLRKALNPMTDQIVVAFVYGSVAKQTDTASSDIDLMLISDTLSYADVFAALENTTSIVGRSINPTVYSKKDFNRRINEGRSFIKRVLTQPKIWIFGQESDIPA
jgi:predicted nucleotidyltransferase